MGLILSGVVTIWAGYMLYKKYKPQGVLFTAGIILLVCAAIFHMGQLVPAKQATGSMITDVFKSVEILFSSRIAGLGLTIMSIGGFVRYMEKTGANRALVEMAATPLKYLHNPTLIFIVAYILGQIISIFIPSHAGMGLLLMLTMYPILVEAGMNKITAVTLMSTSKFTDVGPLSSNAILAAKTGGIDPVIYFIKYQLPVLIPCFIAVAVAHYFVQPWWDRKEAAKSINVYVNINDSEINKDIVKVPFVYGFLPVLPLALIIIFSPLFKIGIKMSVVSAMILSVVVAVIFEIVRTKNLQEVMKNFMLFFDGMGKQFVIVVSLIICAETYAKGLVSTGTIDQLIKLVQAGNFGLAGIAIAVAIIMVVCSFIMGSGNAAFFAFAGLAPKIAVSIGAEPIKILMTMELAAGFGRACSPITPAIVAMAAIAGVNPFHVAKRSAIPVMIGFVVFMITNYIMFL